MKAIMYHGSKQTPVTVEEVSDGSLIVRANDRELFTLQPIAVPAAQPGVIRAVDSAEPPQSFGHITVSDLNGKSSHQRKALIYLRFMNGARFKDGTSAFDDVDGYMFENWEKYLPALQDGTQATAPTQQQNDLDILRPHMSQLVVNGELIRGWQSRIADILNLPNTGGSYRRRILDTGASLLKFYSSTTVENAPITVEIKKSRVA